MVASPPRTSDVDMSPAWGARHLRVKRVHLGAGLVPQMRDSHVGRVHVVEPGGGIRLGYPGPASG